MIPVTTSGTVGQTVIRVADMIDHAIRRAGLTVGQNDPDVTLTARNNLYFILSSLSNEGVNLWTVGKHIIGLITAQAQYELPVGTIDLLKVLYRRVTLPNGGSAITGDAAGGIANAFAQNLSLSYTQVVADGYIGYNFGQPVSIRNVGFMPYGTQTYSLAWEYSPDGTNWTTTYTSPANTIYPDGVWYYADIDGFTGVGGYFRMRETGGGILSVRAVVFGQYPQEIPLGRMNLDMYSQLNQKTNQERQPVQFWFNRQRVNPLITLWETPNYTFDQVVCWRNMEIQDPGSLQNVLEIPQRWIDAITWELAERMIFEIPGADMNRLQAVQQMSAKSRMLAEGEERDPSPITLAPDLVPYTS